MVNQEINKKQCRKNRNVYILYLLVELAVNKFEVSPNIFVNLKQGDITDTYIINKILGEGMLINL